MDGINIGNTICSVCTLVAFTLVNALYVLMILGYLISCGGIVGSSLYT